MLPTQHERTKKPPDESTNMPALSPKQRKARLTHLLADFTLNISRSPYSNSTHLECVGWSKQSYQLLLGFFGTHLSIPDPDNQYDPLIARIVISENGLDIPNALIDRIPEPTTTKTDDIDTQFTLLCKAFDDYVFKQTIAS